MSDQRFDSIDERLVRIEKYLSDYRVKSEGRITKLETVQRGVTYLLGTAIASFFSVVVYLFTGGKG